MFPRRKYLHLFLDYRQRWDPQVPRFVTYANVLLRYCPAACFSLLPCSWMIRIVDHWMRLSLNVTSRLRHVQPLSTDERCAAGTSWFPDIIASYRPHLSPVKKENFCSVSSLKNQPCHGQFLFQSSKFQPQIDAAACKKVTEHVIFPFMSDEAAESFSSINEKDNEIFNWILLMQLHSHSYNCKENCW